MNNPKISAIINCFRRWDSLPLQIEALENQTIPPHEICIWVNASDNFDKFDKKIINKYKTVISNYNYGVWSRFAHVLNMTGDYVCVFDDDTIPGARWFENCMNEMLKHEGLYGTRGLIFKDHNYADYLADVGWHSANPTTTIVDIVGHAWFFPKHYISAFWRETTPPTSNFCGEDIHFSYAIQKYLGAKTLVPPHPVNDLSMWGSIPSYGIKWGCDTNAISEQTGVNDQFKIALNNYHSKGFKLLAEGI